MANFNYNKVILGGRLTADPELRQTSNGIPVTSFSIAIDRRFARNGDQQAQQNADFINIVAWRSNAEFITRYFRKGSSICITGSLQSRSWTDQQGQKRYATEVIVDEATFVDSKAGAAQSQSDPFASASHDSAPAFSGTADSTNFEEIPNDDDLPF
ncbi:MAG: single-stranded DNA-binding protein [Ruminococcaceae bacterium]|nr:single-stranded DNA-binding protein [Oscillospiraceae bacterium]